MNIEEITDDFMNRLPTHIVGFYKDKAEELFKEKVKQARLDGMKEAIEIVEKNKSNIMGVSEFSGGCLTTCNLIMEAIETAKEEICGIM